MLKALVFKELRETIGIALIALLAYLVSIANLIGYPVFPYHQYISQGIPFLNGQFTPWFCIISVCFAIVLGLRQTLGESWRGTWLFLLHRPMEIKKLIGVKILVGLGMYLVVSAAAILVYASWAATPGTHASPFFWWMTTPAWIIWMAIVLCYFSAFLAGIRPGRWVGTRFLPMAATVLLAPPINFSQRWLYGLPLVALMGAIVVGLIFFVARQRDY